MAGTRGSVIRSRARIPPVRPARGMSATTASTGAAGAAAIARCASPIEAIVNRHTRTCTGCPGAVQAGIDRPERGRHRGGPDSATGARNDRLLQH